MIKFLTALLMVSAWALAFAALTLMALIPTWTTTQFLVMGAAAFLIAVGSTYAWVDQPRRITIHPFILDKAIAALEMSGEFLDDPEVLNEGELELLTVIEDLRAVRGQRR